MTHDPLCYYRDDEWLAVQDCAECTMIAKVRADERNNLEQRKPVFKALRTPPYEPPFGMTRDEWLQFVVDELEIDAAREEK